MKLYFRFWDKENHKMIYNYPYSLEKEKELMINTQIKDYNGKDIYEGDIVRQTSIGCRFKEKYEHTGIIVAQSLGKYSIKYYKKGKARSWHLIEVDYDGESDFIKEILGNIYENEDMYKKIKGERK